MFQSKRVLCAAIGSLNARVLMATERAIKAEGNQLNETTSEDNEFLQYADGRVVPSLATHNPDMDRDMLDDPSDNFGREKELSPSEIVSVLQMIRHRLLEALQLQAPLSVYDRPSTLRSTYDFLLGKKGRDYLPAKDLAAEHCDKRRKSGHYEAMANMLSEGGEEALDPAIIEAIDRQDFIKDLERRRGMEAEVLAYIQTNESDREVTAAMAYAEFDTAFDEMSAESLIGLLPQTMQASLVDKLQDAVHRAKDGVIRAMNKGRAFTAVQQDLASIRLDQKAVDSLVQMHLAGHHDDAF